MGKINLLKKIAGYRGVKKRAGFTLIEVIVAMGIFMIVVLALLGSYYSYYRAVKDLRYKTIGENLAQLQLEDIQNLAVSIIDNIIDGTEGYPLNYPKDQGLLNDHVYYSGLIDSAFVIDGLTDFPDTFVLPSSIVPDKVNGTLKLDKWESPRYFKEFWITDRTPDLDQQKNKIYEIKITISWDLNDDGVMDNSVTFTGEKAYARSLL